MNDIKPTENGVNAAESMSKKEFQAVELAPQTAGGSTLALTTFAEMEKLAIYMATSNFMPKHLRGKPGDCLAVVMQATRWGMDPIAVGQKTYFVNDGMGYEAQLVNAIVLARAPLSERPKMIWSGEGENLKCKVSGIFKGETTPAEFEAELKTITTRNSPLWKQQPKQQLGYFATRAWARLYCPDIIMGVYTVEELSDPSFYGPDNAKDVTPEATHAATTNKLDAFAEKKPAAHDKETGEIIEHSQVQSSDDVAFEQPVKISLMPMPGDATKNDWEAWTEELLRMLPMMSDLQSLKKLEELNKVTLGNLAKTNPPKHEYIVEQITLRFTELGGMDAGGDQ